VEHPGITTDWSDYSSHQQNRQGTTDEAFKTDQNDFLLGSAIGWLLESRSDSGIRTGYKTHVTDLRRAY